MGLKLRPAARVRAAVFFQTLKEGKEIKKKKKKSANITKKTTWAGMGALCTQATDKIWAARTVFLLETERKTV